MVGYNKIEKLLAIKIAILVLFAFYYSSIAFFPHRHIIGESVIVHSHPHKKDSQGNPSHTHSKQELQVIQALSAFFITTTIVPCVTVKPVLCLVRKDLFISHTTNKIITFLKSDNKLRAPPAFC